MCRPVPVEDVGRRRSGGSSSGGHTEGRGPAGGPRRRPSFSHSGRRVTVPSRPEYRECPMSYQEACSEMQKTCSILCDH